MGEYQALSKLNGKVKDKVFPLIIVPPVEYDFEEKRPKKTVQEHIAPFDKRLATKWGKRDVVIDLHQSLENGSMADGNSVLSFIFNKLRASNSNAIPTLKLRHDKLYIGEIKKIISSDKRGLALRLSLSDLMSPKLANDVLQLLQYLNLTFQEVDLVLDLEVPKNFEPYSTFAMALIAGINRVPGLNDYRSFFIASMSLELSEVKKPGSEPTRHEWYLYRELTKLLSDSRVPNYADYTIEHPDFISQDMRFLNPAGKIVYTTENTWFIPKGGSFRDNRAQMIKHCESIMKSGYYSGQHYSVGDQRIHDTYHGIEGTGNQGTWKQAGVSHHITLIVDLLSKYHGS